MKTLDKITKKGKQAFDNFKSNVGKTAKKAAPYIAAGTLALGSLGTFSNDVQAQSNQKGQSVSIKSRASSIKGGSADFGGAKMHNTNYLLIESDNPQGFNLAPHSRFTNKDTINNKLIQYEIAGDSITNLKGKVEYMPQKVDRSRVKLRSDTTTPLNVVVGQEKGESSGDVISGGFTLNVQKVQDKLRYLEIRNDKNGNGFIESNEKDTLYFPYTRKDFESNTSGAIENGSMLPFYTVERESGKPLIVRTNEGFYLQGEINKWVATEESNKNLGELVIKENDNSNVPNELITYCPCYPDKHSKEIKKFRDKSGIPGEADTLIGKATMEKGSKDAILSFDLQSGEYVSNNKEGQEHSFSPQFEIGKSNFSLGPYVKFDNAKNISKDSVEIPSETVYPGGPISITRFGDAQETLTVNPSGIGNKYVSELGLKAQYNGDGWGIAGSVGYKPEKMEQKINSNMTLYHNNANGNVIDTTYQSGTNVYNTKGDAFVGSLEGRVYPIQFLTKKGENNFGDGLYIYGKGSVTSHGVEQGIENDFGYFENPSFSGSVGVGYNIRLGGKEE